MKTKTLLLVLSLSIASFNSYAVVGDAPVNQNIAQTQTTDGTMPSWAVSTRATIDGFAKVFPVFGPASGALTVFLGLTGFIFPNPAMTSQQKTQQSLDQIKKQLNITNNKLDNITSMYIQDSSIAEEKNLFNAIKIINDSSNSYVAELGNSKSLDDYMIANQNDFATLKVIDSTIGSVDAYNKIKQARTTISTTKYLNQLIAVIQRVNEKTNLPAPGTTDYIALHNSTNQLFLYYYSTIVAALSEAYELNRLAFYLESSDPYKNYYATRIGNADGISSSLTYAEKIAKLDETYKTALDNVNKAFNQQKLINVYRDLPAYDSKVSANDFYAAYGVTYYDGKTIKGTKNYGKLESVPYSVQAAEIYELGKVRQYNGQAYYVNQSNQDIYTPNYPAHIIDATDVKKPISAATRYDWNQGMINIVIPVNSFANVQIVENLYNSTKLEYNSNDPMWKKTFYQSVGTVRNGQVCDRDYSNCYNAISKSFNNIMVATDKASGKQYMFSLSVMQVGGNYWGYVVNSNSSAYVVSRLACATFDCSLVQPKDGSHSYLQFADGYKIWMTGDGGTNPGRGIVGSYTEKPSKQ
ncbi:MAG TPA: hypothetical protein PLP75_14000 [Burkholderiales bacterium]|mgnify:CR=1 FL=1|nr:hypothetical protein [Burkholderiales bacterium]